MIWSFSDWTVLLLCDGAYECDAAWVSDVVTTSLLTCLLATFSSYTADMHIYSSSWDVVELQLQDTHRLQAIYIHTVYQTS